MLEMFVFKISGVSSLMLSNPEEFINDSEAEGNDGALKVSKKKTYDKNEEAAKRVYKDDDGNFVVLAAAFRRALITAATGRKFGKVAARNLISGGTFPAEDLVIICDEKGKPAKKYDIDSRSVVIKSGQKRNRVMRHRPKWKKWTMSLAMEIDTELIAAEQVLDVLNVAGRIIGIGEFRPDPSDGKSGVGTFGRFKAELVA